MAAKPKLTHEEWNNARKAWESDPRKSFPWLIEELDLPVSSEAVRLRAKAEGWAKGGADKKPSLEKPKTKLGKQQKPSLEKSVVEPPLQTTKEKIESNPDQFGVFDQLNDKQEIFVREYMVDWNATQAAIRAGYSPDTASQKGYQLIQNSSVRAAIESLASERARRLGIDAEEMMKLWSSIVMLDANEISQLRRICCPFCWGNDHQRQYTPSGLEDAIKRHDRERAKRIKVDENDDIGEFPEYSDDWYDKRKEPHEDCPECHGEGVVEVFLSDSRKLSPAAKMLYAGVKEGRDGIEVLTLSKEKAMDSLARALGMFKEKEIEVNINMVSSDELFSIYEDRMRKARERQALVFSERGILSAESNAHLEDK